MTNPIQGPPFCPDCGEPRPLSEFRTTAAYSGNGRVVNRYCRLHENTRKREARHEREARGGFAIKRSSPFRKLPVLAADESRKAPITHRICAGCEKRLKIEQFPMVGRHRRLTCQSCLYPVTKSAPPPIPEPKPAPVVLAPRPANPGRGQATEDGR